MAHDVSNRDLLTAWTNGDQAAAAILFHRYQQRLMALVRSRLSRKLARRVDPEDIVLSAYRSFFAAARNGRDCAPADDDLWPLLTTISLRKLAHQARRHSAGQRAVDREQSDLADWIDILSDHEPGVEQAAVLSDEVERLLGQLDANAREVLVRTLQGDDVPMIATALAINERTVRRALERIRAQIGDGGTAIPPFVRATLSVAFAAAPSRPTGETITYDQYLLQQFIGSGAFSKVYRAVERATGKVVAIKFLRRECWNDPRATAALIREFEILKLLDHPGVLKMHGWGSTPRGALLLVTDFVPGVNLSEWRRTQNPSAVQIASVVRRVAEAVAAAHAASVLHCDLKPSNVMMRDDGQVILCDFGLARHSTDPEDLPRGGTAGFLSPEQVSDAFGPVTQRSDVYGLGGLLYALLTGRPTMSGRDLPETIANVLSARVAAAPSQFSTVSNQELDAIAVRCLQKEPDRRFGSVLEVAEALCGRV